MPDKFGHPTRDEREAERRARIPHTEELWRQVEETRAALHPIACLTCNDLGWVSVDDGGGTHLERCPDTANHPAPSMLSETEIINQMADWYVSHGLDTQVVTDFGDEDELT
jgi:hypothetical protein